MNEELKQALNEQGAALVGRLADYVELAEGQAPLVVNEIIMMGLISAILTLIACVGVTGLFAALTATFNRARKIADAERRDTSGWEIGLTVMIILDVIGFFCICGSIYGWLLVLYCPRVYVLQQLGTLLGGS